MRNEYIHVYISSTATLGCLIDMRAAQGSCFSKSDQTWTWVADWDSKVLIFATNFVSMLLLQPLYQTPKLHACAWICVCQLNRKKIALSQWGASCGFKILMQPGKFSEFFGICV